MASLTHVNMWSGYGWKRISIAEATKLHPEGTVSVHSGLFMCELCGQYVLLTDGGYQVRHFRHSSHEKSKDCPERTRGAAYSATYSPGEHNLPIRITDVTPTNFQFQLGLIRAPIRDLSKDFRIEIKPKGFHAESFIYSKERLNYDGITYLPIGDKPFETYHLSFHNGTEKLSEFWPKEIKGIDAEGTFFEKTSGRMLTNDSDVEIGKEYYLLKKGDLYVGNSSHEITIREVSSKRVFMDTWFMYSVFASEFNEGAARFFLNYHCRLTEQPISLQPVWPLFVEGSYVIKHNQNNSIILVKGNASSVKTFPATTTTIQKVSSHPTTYEVLCFDRMQLISIGRTKVLQYTYFWKESIGAESTAPEIKVTNISGSTIEPGKVHVLPKEGLLMFSSPYDGELVISRNGCISDKHKILANQVLKLDTITWGINIRFCVGLDCLWEASYEKGCTSSTTENEEAILKYFASGNRNIISAPHALRSIAIGFKKYPKVFSWIKRCIKEGKIDALSYRRLQIVYRRNKMEHTPGGKQ